MESNPYTAPSANLFTSSTDQASLGAINQLQRTKPWVRFLGVIMWIVVAFMMIGAVGMSLGTAVMTEAFNKTNPGMGDMVAKGLAAFYVIFGLLYIYPTLKIWKYGTCIGKLVKSGSNTDLESALEQQRKFWKFVGIAVILMIILYIVFAVIMGVVMFSAVASGNLPKS